jgi:hypothetical protein
MNLTRVERMATHVCFSYIDSEEKSLTSKLPMSQLWEYVSQICLSRLKVRLCGETA